MKRTPFRIDVVESQNSRANQLNSPRTQTPWQLLLDGKGETVYSPIPDRREN